ncbi:hypothetical protein Tco_0877353 [Tanacetum coccineum]|uniref:Uncharacterized protein n=1 Tax=Tanacetum coccineum TaxID=301880 RepID=A0ABQ5BXT3_9ASTR
MRVDEIHKFCDETLKSVHILRERLLNFKFGYNKDMPLREWTTKDKKRLGIMLNKIDDRLFKRWVLRSLEVLGLEVGLIRRIQGIGYGVLDFLGVGTTFDIFQNIHILYIQYGVLVFSGYGVLSLFPLWSLVSAGTDTPYLP